MRRASQWSLLGLWIASVAQAADSTAVDAFLKAPTPENYAPAQQALIASPAYRPYQQETMDAVLALVAKQQYAEARGALEKAWDNWALSPRAHALAAQIAEKLGDAAAAKREDALAAACLRGILSTGDGTIEKPYRIARIEDEYDVARHLQKKVRQQVLVHQKGRTLDVLQFKDASELHFDATPLMETLRPK